MYDGETTAPTNNIVALTYAQAMADRAAAEARLKRGFDVLENPSLLPGQLVLSGPHSALDALARKKGK